jgi:peptidoglycan/xylan/chitin deacetylase (PgdA/CDA1 family)
MDSGYTTKREKITREFAGTEAGAWGEFVAGVNVQFDTRDKLIALTFDACGGQKSSGYDSSLIAYLKAQKIHATLFVSGKWIDANYNTFHKLSKDTLFEIENHGLNHKPCSMHGETAYGIKGTTDLKAAYDEIEAGAVKIQKITGRKPGIYRSATAFIDETCARMAKKMGYSVISYDVLSTDAMPFLPAEEIKQAVVQHIHPGAIAIMHFNHPEWNTSKALSLIIPELRKQGYSFVLLKNQHLLPHKPKIKH